MSTVAELSAINLKITTRRWLIWLCVPFVLAGREIPGWLIGFCVRVEAV